MMYLTQSLHRNLQQCPEATAIRYQGQQWTYRQFGERVTKLAGALRRLGAADGERVALMSLNSARYLEYVMAVPWAGGALNPVNTRWSAAEIAYSLDDSQTHILLVDDAFAPLTPEILERSQMLKHIVYVGDGPTPYGMLSYEQLLAEGAPVEDALRGGNDLAGIFYTGGTTGFPKGVMLSHTNLCSAAIAMMAEGLANGSSFLHAAPMFHVADFAHILCVFMRGATHVVVPAFDSRVVLEVIQQEKVTDTVLVPTMVQMLLRDQNISEYDLDSLERIVYGASAMPMDTLDTALVALPGTSFIQGYGMTETAALIAISCADNHTQAGRENGRIRSAGRASFLQEIKIIDEQGKEVPLGTVGEVTVRGPNIMMGYWNKPEVTAEVIKSDWLHTGDGGYMDEYGYVYIVDRLKDMIISGGENVYTAEVESAVMQHPDVAQCAVIGIPSDEWGEAVHAVIVLVADRQPTLEVIRKHCKTIIAGYKCPSSIEIVDALPLSGAGKVLKTALRKKVGEGAN